MQIKRYPTCLKISLSINSLIKAIHPSYSSSQIESIKPYLVAVLKKCKHFPFKHNGVSITADSVNSWYIITGSAKSIAAFVHTLVQLELSGHFLQNT